MHNPSPAPRYRYTQHYHRPRLDSRDSDAETPQAGPSRISPRTRAQDVYSSDEDDEYDAEATPKILTKPPPDPSRVQPLGLAQAAETPSARLHALMQLVPPSQSTTTSYRHAIPPTPSDNEPESDFEIPNVTASSLARESLASIFSNAYLDTPRKDGRRRNSIDQSEVEDIPRVQSVVRERARIKEKRRSMSDEEAEKFSRSFQKSEGTRSSAATFDALREKLQSSVNAPPPRPLREPGKVPERAHRGFSLQQYVGAQDAEDRESQSDRELSDDAPEASGETVTITRHLNQEPTATPMTLKSFQMPSHIQMQSNLMDQDSGFQHDMGRLDSSYEGASRTTQRGTAEVPPPAPVDVSSVSFPMAELNENAAIPHPFSKARKPQGIPVPKRMSGGTSSRSSSLSAAEFQDRIYDDEQEKLRERERLWNKRNGPSTPEHRRRLSSGSPSFNTTIRPSPRSFMRRTSGTSIQSIDDGRSSRASSISSRTDNREADSDKLKEREKMWNKPQRRSSSSMSLRSPSDRPGSSNIPTRPDSAQSYHYNQGNRPQSWHSSDGASPRPSIDIRPDKETVVSWERERNWRSPNPKWEYQVPRVLTPLPDPPEGGPSPYAYHGIPIDSPLHPNNRPEPRFVLPTYAPISPSPKRPRPRTRTQSMTDSPSGRLYSPLKRGGTESRIPVPRSDTPPSRSSSVGLEEGGVNGSGGAQKAGYVSRFGWSPKNYRGAGSARRDKDGARDEREEEGKEESLPPASASRIPALSFTKRNSYLVPRPVSTSRNEGVLDQRMDEMQSMFKSRAKDGGGNSNEAAIGRMYRKISAEMGPAEATAYLNGRVNPEPVEVSTEVEAETATDFDTESDTESHATATEPTPIARPMPLPPSVEEVEEVESEVDSRPPSPPRTPPLAQSSYRDEMSADSEQFYSMAAPASAPPRAPSPPRTPPGEPARRDPEYTLQTPPRWASASSKMEFETPPPPRNMPDLPGPPSSSEEETHEGRTPPSTPFAGANLTAIKTPKPPGGWDATPVPTQRAIQREAVQAARAAPASPPAPAPIAVEAATPEAAQPSESVIMPTPAPPGGWLLTPASSMRRKSILKVRFDVDPNTSGESLASVPLVGPSDSISEIFPAVDPTPRRDKGKGKDASDDENPERPSTPPTVRAKPRAPRSPGLRMVDAYGREVVEEDTPSPVAEQLRPKPKSKAKAKKSAGEQSSRVIARKRPPPVPMRMVDAMGREITEVSIEDSEHSESYELPLSRTEAMSRVRKSLATLVDELGESDTSRELLPRNEQRLNDLYNASNAARVARKNINESLQKHKAVEDDLRSKYGSLRESMNKNKLLPPVVSPHRYSINFLNAWVLWVLLIFQVFVLIYMYHLSTVRAKHIFLTTYYDAFQPDLFLHLTKHRAIPSSASWSMSVISETLIRTGWRGLMSEMWGNVTLLVDDVRNNLWTAWGQQRTPAWPPT